TQIRSRGKYRLHPDSYLRAEAIPPVDLRTQGLMVCTVLTFVARLVLGLLRLLFFPVLALRRARRAPKGAWLTIDVDGQVADVVHLPLGGDTKELYVASAADEIYVGPQATLAPLGFSTSVRYVKGALAKAGLEPQVLARGTYKSAGEQLVRESMSDAQREQLEAIHDVFYAQLLLAIGEGRKKGR